VFREQEAQTTSWRIGLSIARSANQEEAVSGSAAIWHHAPTRLMQRSPIERGLDIAPVAIAG
jgi:hypothetical protein